MYAYAENNPVNLVDPYGLDVGLPGFITPPVAGGLPGFGGESGGFDLPGFGPSEGPIGLPGFPGQSGTPSMPGFSGGNDCGGKENAQDCASQGNGDLFSSTGENKDTTSAGDTNTGYGGHDFENDGRNGGEVLPKEDENGNEITYTTYYLSSKKSGERKVVGSDGSVYYTDNHYFTFRRVN